ncbi:hypothetical protein CEXT_547351 [Caerostris extrusa]|uniref:Uncharacterized protein n=1 Tax=Caerostris extrusa TaxID=172846 RepID=A0AAV4WHK1_CAEEX|nr:hypothetical protein CEXT_547351 [Caerostris extrusa]
MEVSSEGNEPAEVHLDLTVAPNADANASTTVTPEGMCRQLVTANKELKILDDILASTKNSDMPQDYLQMNANLLMKRQYLVEWVSKSGSCPIAKCTLHNSNKITPKSNVKRNASEISSRKDKRNVSEEFLTPNKKLTAKANFTSSKVNNQTEIQTSNKFNSLGTDEVTNVDETVTVVRKLPPIMVKPKANLKDMLKKLMKLSRVRST